MGPSGCRGTEYGGKISASAPSFSETVLSVRETVLSFGATLPGFRDTGLPAGAHGFVGAGFIASPSPRGRHCET